MLPRSFGRSGFAAAVLSLLGGCVTMDQQVASALPQLQAVNQAVNQHFSDLSDTLSPQMREIKKLIGEQKFADADAFFAREQDYFSKRLQGDDKPLPDDIRRLADHVWAQRYKPEIDELTTALQAVTSLADNQTWPAISNTLKAASQLSDGMGQDPLLQLTRRGGTERQMLDDQVKRITALAVEGRGQALASTFRATLAQGKHTPAYVGTASFTTEDYLSSAEFQTMALQRIRATTGRDAYFAQATLLGAYLSAQAQAEADAGFVERVRGELMADGQISLEEVSTLGSTQTPFGGGKQALSKLVTIGYIDLSTADSRNRAAFDFPVTFTQDAAVEFAPASVATLSSAGISRYDYLFVTDLSAARITRQFKEKKEVQSRAQTGTQEVQNPAYIAATSNYQQAMVEFQRAQISAAIPKFCRGWGCVLQGVSDGIDQGATRNNVNQASAVLAGTSQTLSMPVYTGYTY